MLGTEGGRSLVTAHIKQLDVKTCRFRRARKGHESNQSLEQSEVPCLIYSSTTVRIPVPHILTHKSDVLLRRQQRLWLPPEISIETSPVSHLRKTTKPDEAKGGMVESGSGG